MRILFLLTDPETDYTGGNFEINTGGNSEIVPFPKGRIIAFPSFILHRVTPVTSGTRKSIVIWVTGPKFI